MFEIFLSQELMDYGKSKRMKEGKEYRVVLGVEMRGNKVGANYNLMTATLQ